MATENLLLVFSNPAVGREEEYNAWYDGTHIPDVLDVPGVVGADRYALAPGGGSEPEHRYLAIYRLDRDPAEVIGELQRRFASGEIQMSDAIDLTTISMTTWASTGND